jgi:hypothetical protein
LDILQVMFAQKDLSVGAERLGRWLAGFEERHGATTYDAEPSVVVVTAADGSVAGVPAGPLAELVIEAVALQL